MRCMRRGEAWSAVAVLGACALLGGGRMPPGSAPDLVFVSRADGPAGLGANARVHDRGGDLLVRRSGGAIETWLDTGDVMDPAVSPDARLVAFARGRGPRSRIAIQVMRTSDRTVVAEVPGRDDVLDTSPAWLDDSTLVFVRGTIRDTALYAGVLAAQLWAWRLGAPAATPLTAERNGVLDPAVDTRRGRIVFARWWYNPWQPSESGPLTRTAEGTTGEINVWQLVSARPAWIADTLRLLDVRLAAGGIADREAGMGVQPAVLPDGSIIATHAFDTGLVRRQLPAGIQRFRQPGRAGDWLAGALPRPSAATPYEGGANLAAPSAFGPTALPDGSLIVSLDAGSRGDVGLWRVHPDGPRAEPVWNDTASWELDAAPIVRRRPLRIARVERAAAATFRYENRDVFAGRGAPARVHGARLLVFRDGERIASAPVDARGAVALELPAGAPLFEMLVDSAGRALATPHGPALVRGFNAGSRHEPSRCDGCHLGHSIRR